jgi:sec-independent protein translocase protein TatA
VVGDILQPTHLLLILVVALLVLGPKRLPEVGRSLGKGLRDFRHALNSIDEHHEQFASPPTVEAPAVAATPTPPVAATPPPTEPLGPTG